MMKSFNDFGRFYFGADKGGSYTPQPGDVIVIGVYNDEVQDATHVGIVEKVVGNIVYTVEGNASDRVRHKNYSLSDSSIIGYGHPNYENSGHIASSYTSTSAGHSGTCMNCGAEFTEAHDLACVELDDSNHQDKCTVCQYVASTSAHTVGTDYHYDNTNHWHECGDCGHKEDVAAHTYGLYQSDSSAHWRVCTQCGGASARVAHRFLTKPNGSRYCRTCGYPNSFDEIEGGNIGEEAA